MTHPVIHISHLTKRFGDLTAVDDISLSVHEGDVYGVLGQNGAGKTTTISMILGLVQANHGQISVFGHCITPQRNQPLRQIGSLIGDVPAYVPYLTGRQNVAAVASLFGMSSSRVDEVMDFMGIADASDKLPDLYSTGMKQRLGLAMAIVHKPKLLILDEPTNGMDPTGMREMRHLIKELAAQHITILLCSHLLHEVEQICNRIAVFHHGKIITESAIDALNRHRQIVCIHTTTPEETARFLKQIPGVSDIHMIEDTVQVQGLSSQAVIEQLVLHKLPPAQVYMKRHSLEEIFLQLISEESN